MFTTQSIRHSRAFQLLCSGAILSACGGDLGDSSSSIEGTTATSVETTGEALLARGPHGGPGASARSLSPRLLGRYATGIEGLASSGETAALLRTRLYVTSAAAVALDVVDVSNPSAPTLLRRVDLSAYGASVQSVDVSEHGLVAVAVGAANKTDPGTVVFLDRNGRITGNVTVGALPDMLVFTPDGDKLVVANEGEPDCYGTGCVDPEGSVSIVEFNHRGAPRVRNVSFEGVAIPPAVRIFGPGASPAQDLEPEAITISRDGETAYVTLQENNAIAVVDLKRARVTQIRALGYKDFSTAPTTESFEITRLPSIGSTAAGQELQLGGFSGLHYAGKTREGNLEFITHTDRGPNGEPTGSLRPFLLPDFAPRLVRLEVNRRTGSARVTQQLWLRNADGSALTGLPNTAIAGGDANTPYNDEVPVDLFGQVVPLDGLGGDFEGIAQAADGSFWLADEYRPALYHFSARGRLLARLIPIGTHAAAGLPVPEVGVAGELGIEALPAVIAQRRQNRGFEGLALQGDKLYGIVQSPLRNPATLANSALNAMKNVRLVEVDLASLTTRQFIYIMDNPASTGPDDTRADKIGDMAAVPGGGFMMLERDDDALPEDPAETITKKVYSFSLAGATDITALDTTYAGKSLDQMTAAELTAAGIRPIAKTLHLDLVRAGYANLEKVEGLAYIDPTTVAVVNDNDFMVAGIAIDQATGTFTRLPTYQPEPEVLGIIKSSGIDASDRDGVVNVREWPAFGMYQPDAIANFSVGGRTFLLTANEGDARDWPGLTEEARTRSVRNLYPNIPEAADDLQLGRLTITTAPPGGDLSRPYAFGTRSFSLWDARSGAQLWDSGSEFESVTAAALPGFFNSNHEANDFDTRSDNKGPEPEGIAVGSIGGRTYAFIALERVGGVMIYDVSDGSPEFVQYLNPRDFGASPVGPDSGPEVVRFVPREHSPTHDPLLVIAHEISGTVTLWDLDPR